MQVKPFLPKVGEKFVLLSSSALTAKFGKVNRNKIEKSVAKKYEPFCAGRVVTLGAIAAAARSRAQG